MKIKTLTAVAVLLLAIALLKSILIVSANPLIAYANNTDFARVSACMGLWQHSPNKVAKTAAHFEGPVNSLYYDGDAAGGWCLHSIDNIYAQVATMFHLTGERVDFRLIGKLRMLLLIAISIWAMTIAQGAFEKMAVGIVSLLVFGDMAYISYFNTLYTEFSVLVGVVFGTMAIVFVWRASDASRIKTNVQLLIGSMLLLGLSKAQYSPLASVLGIAFAVIVATRFKIYRLAVLLICISIVIPIAFSAANPPKIGVVRDSNTANKFNTFIQAVIPETRDPLATLQQLKLPQSCAEGLGKIWYAKGIEENRLCAEVESISRVTLLSIFLREPQSFYRPLFIGITQMQPLLLSHLPNWETEGARQSRRYRLAKWTSLTTLLDAFPNSIFVGIAVLSFAAGAVGCLVVRRRLRKASQLSDQAWILIGLGGIVAFYAVLSSVFGDGYAELSKHGFLLGVGYALQTTGVIAYWIAYLDKGKSPEIV